MGQLIACATAEGVFLASDSRTVFFEPAGEERFIEVDRLIPISSHVVVTSAGALEAHDVAKDFADFAKKDNLTDIDELIEAAIPYFTSRYDEIIRKICEKLPLDPVINLYLLLAGFSAKTPDHPGRLFIIWDRARPPKIESNRVTSIFTLPRRMGLEFKLNQLVNQKARLYQVAAAARAGMEKLASQDQYLGPPYHYLTITAAGVAKV
jgi:hypothetical protein